MSVFNYDIRNTFFEISISVTSGSNDHKEKTTNPSILWTLPFRHSGFLVTLYFFIHNFLLFFSITIRFVYIKGDTKTNRLGVD